MTGVTSEGAGVGRLADGRAVFVQRTAPGDLAEVQIVQARGRWARAHLVALREPGSVRRPAPCVFYDRCGGCTLQHLAYSAQVVAKGQVVRDALERIGGMRDVPDPILHSAGELRYRNRVTFTLRRDFEGRTVAGLHALGRPWDLVEVDGRCLLPETAIARAWDALRGSWGPGADLLPGGAELRVTLWGATSGHLMLWIEGGEASWAGAEALLEAVPGLATVWHRPGDATREPEPGRGAFERREAMLVAGQTGLPETWFGEEVIVTPGAFLQTNRELAPEVHAAVLDASSPAAGRRILDAYCGFGLYGRRLAARGARVVGIELSRAAIGMAVEAPPAGFRAIQGRVEDHVGEGLPADIVILNPPRAGVGPRIMERLDGERTARVIYVSCDSATLARDVRRLGDAYRIASLRVFDLFPQTSEVETVLVLDRAA